MNLLPDFAYKTLGITSQGVLKNSLARVDPLSGSLLKGYPVEVVVRKEREITRTVSITGTGKVLSPNHSSTGRRRLAILFPAALRHHADAWCNLRQSLSFQDLLSARTARTTRSGAIGII